MADIPQRIGKYTILNRIAGGGMSSVFLAEHPTLEKQLVIKKLTMQGSGHIQQRFLREAKLMFSFKSDYIVDVYDHFVEGEAFHIVQEHIDGISLEDLIERDRYLPEYIALRIFLYAARSLQYAHAKGVVHRDIKPGNILISTDGMVKLADFGIASIRDQRTDEDLTQVGMTLGTPAYMAPEQFTSSRDVDHRADIYSLGVMLYEMLTGKKPYPSSGKLPETYQRIIKGKYRHPRRHNPNISRFTLRMIKQCMHPKLKKRTQNLSSVIRRLEKHFRIKPVVGKPFEFADMLADYVAGKRLEPARKIVTGARLLSAAVLLIVLGTVGSGIYYTGLHRRLLFPEQYGRVVLSVDTELAGGKNSAQWKQLPRQYTLTPLSADTEQASFDLHPGLPRYLPAGSYRLQSTIGARQLARTVYLLPHDRQYAGDSGEDLNRLTIHHTPPIPRPLRIDTSVRDQLAGHDITEVSRLEAYHQDRFYPLSQLLQQEALLSGSEIHLRISRPGYYSQEIKLSPRRNEHELQVNAALVPRPGRLTVETNDADCELRINDRDHYTAGGPRPHSTAIPELSVEEPTRLALPPDRYTLQARHPGGAKTEIGLHIGSQQNVHLVIQYDEENDTVHLTGVEQ